MVSGSALRTVVPTRVSLRAFLGCRPVCVRACVRVCVCVYVCVCVLAHVQLGMDVSWSMAFIHGLWSIFFLSPCWL